MPTFPAFPARSNLRAFALATGFAVFALSAHAGTLEETSRLLRAGQHAEALKQVDRYLATRPKDAQGRFLKGIILTGLNRQNDAITIFQRLTQDYPDLPEPHNNLAVIYAQQKQYEKAKEALEKAIRTHPAYATAHENLGDIYSRLASQAYGKALQIDASNTSAQTKLAMIDDLVGADRAAPAGTAIAAAAPKPRPTPPPAVAPVPVVPPAPVAVVAPVAPAAKPAEPAARPVPAAAPPPAPKPEPAKPAPAATESDVIAAVDAWLAAWSRRDAKGYLAHYASNFETPRGQARKAWETERTQRITRPASISVTRDNLSVRIDGNDKASVRFRQTYRAPGFNATTTKTLTMLRQSGKWLIQQERTN